MSAKVARITGVTGQDGAYLAEFLLVKGYQVHDVKRPLLIAHQRARRSHLFRSAFREHSLPAALRQPRYQHPLAESIVKVVGVEGRLRFDSSMPDGAPRKLLDSGRLLAMGWKPQTGLEDGLRKAYAWYLDNVAGKPARS